MIRRIKLSKGKESLSSSSRLGKEDKKDNSELNQIRKDEISNNIAPQMKLNYSFNVFEIIISSFCKCCMSKNLALKNNIYRKANDILLNKLDIVIYIRNMILIDIINETLFTENKMGIINFLSRPLLSINKNDNYDSPEFYQNYNENNFIKFYDDISELIQKTNKKEKEKNLILLVNKSLKQFL